LELDKLSKIVDIRYFFRSDGDVVAFTENGRTLNLGDALNLLSQ